MNKVNITNGEAFNTFMEANFEETFIPFNEAMVEGKPHFPLFESEFIVERCCTHKVTMDTYLEVGKRFLDLCRNMDQYDTITLWFGQDMFCQMNLLAVLTYLEQRSYKGKLYTIIIDDETRGIVEDKRRVDLGKFIRMYKCVFQEGKKVKCGNKYLDKGIKEYIELQDDTHELVCYIKNNSDKMECRKMFENVWEITRKYGLGDTQVKNLIEKYSAIRFEK